MSKDALSQIELMRVANEGTRLLWDIDQVVLELLRREGKMTSRRIMLAVFGDDLPAGDRTVMSLTRLWDADLIDNDLTGFWAL